MFCCCCYFYDFFWHRMVTLLLLMMMWCWWRTRDCIRNRLEAGSGTAYILLERISLIIYLSKRHAAAEICTLNAMISYDLGAQETQDQWTGKIHSSISSVLYKTSLTTFHIHEQKDITQYTPHATKKRRRRRQHDALHVCMDVWRLYTFPQVSECARRSLSRCAAVPAAIIQAVQCEHG